MADVANTLEVLDFAIGVLKDLEKAKSDDGEISVVEIVSLSLANASGAIKAAYGAGEIGVELKDLDASEIKAIAEKAIEIGKAAMALFGSK